ncbi:class 3 adenylate cyclase/predicted ATPase [Ensifer sp. WSM1721]|uniref:AAA family ATPase n=1 Tax=Ensifer sp. WSM1721 TaxID=1041159 RepID=UPI00047D860F|nr:adenylate/guanylate cyclase domain-containing protein [Ensifer sp. WSM1721]
MDVGAWLCDLGLAQYEQEFRANDIDAEVLADLTAEDLIALGITSVGHRRKLLAAIAALRDGADAMTAVPNAERRQLTVMFVDLVDSTALASRLDPEEMSELLRAYRNAVAAAITRFEGHIAKYMGDGVLAYFGYPRAHEDEAERALRAGLAVVEGIHRLRPKHDLLLEVRVGIATGAVVVGELIGAGEARERSVVGQTPNLAARLQSLAGPNGVVISRSTRRLVGGLFDLADLGSQDIKGFAKPVRAWRVIGESQAESRFDALHAAGLTPLVGREEELALLQRRWDQARDAEGQVILLSGEPGIGKSRLTRALQQRLDEIAYTRIMHFCSPYHINSALRPIIDHLQRAAGFSRDDDDEQKLAKLEQLLAQSTADVKEVAPFFAALLSIPTGGRYLPLNLAPEEQMSKTLDALADQVEGLARRRPVLALFEDVHWIDPTTLELLEQLIERVRSLPVLLVITFRPEFRHSWTGYPHVTSLTLNRLSRKSGCAMVERLTAGKTLPTEVLQQIVAKTDGVPLFVEELTKNVLESGLLREEGGSYMLAGPLPPLAIPATLQDSLTARLDRLIPVKEVAQVGAIIGREFSYELLALVIPLRNNELHEALARLEESELVYRRGTPPHATFAFKHALVQEAAYESLLRSKRQQMHATVARAIEEHFPEKATTQPEILARHYSEAGLAEQAICYWLKAGQQAAELSANAEAIGHLMKGLDVLKSIPASRRRDELELNLQTALGMPLIATKGYGAGETGAAYSRAHELCERLSCSDKQRFPILYGQWAYNGVLGKWSKGRQLAEQFVAQAEHGADLAMKVVGHRILGLSLAHLGDLRAGREEIEQALSFFDPHQHRVLAFRFGQDQRVAGLAYLSVILWLSGFPDRASHAMDCALEEVGEIKHLNSRGYLFAWGAAILAHFRRDAAAVRRSADALISLCEEHGLLMWLAYGRVFRGWASGAQGRPSESISEITQGIADCRATGTLRDAPYHLSLLAETLHRVGKTEAALEALQDALGFVAKTEERWWEAELYRLKGELLLSLATSDPTEAEPCYRSAIEVAQIQGAKMLELRAATSLAHLWQNQGKCAEAYRLLAPVYEWFSEGFDTSDLKEARSLLETLADGKRSA